MSEDDLTRDRGAFFGSIFATLNHLLWGDRIWMSRFSPDVSPPDKPAAQHVEITATIADWSAERFRLDGAIRDWADNLDSVALQGQLEWFSGMNQKNMSTPVAQAVVHFFNHQTHHRGADTCHAHRRWPQGASVGHSIHAGGCLMGALAPSRRLRRTPFADGVEAAGVKAYTVYNHMLLPTVFRTVEEDYRHLKEAVQVWDVSCERQVELRGPDAARLVQMLTPRDLRGMLPGQCYYMPIVDETGGMLNDPVVLKLSEDRWWISIADSDLLFWVKGIAYGYRLDVLVDEPDVSPLAVQGPLADDLMAEMFGDGVRDIKFFRFGWFDFQDTQFAVARSGYSKQGGFEIYVEGSQYGMAIWNTLMEAGKRLDVYAGCPNLIERIEGGLLSYGNDMTRDNTPHEAGLGKFCNTQTAIGCVGRDALLRVAKEGPVRQIRPIEIEASELPGCDRLWPVRSGQTLVGHVSSAAVSPDVGAGVAIGMIRMTHWDAGTELVVDTPDGERNAIIRDRFWI